MCTSLTTALSPTPHSHTLTAHVGRDKELHVVMITLFAMARAYILQKLYGITMVGYWRSVHSLAVTVVADVSTMVV